MRRLTTRLLNVSLRHRLWTSSVLSLMVPLLAFSTTFKVQDWQHQQHEQQIAQRQHLAAAWAAEVTAQIDFRGAKVQREALAFDEKLLQVAWATIDRLVAALDSANADRDSLNQQIGDLRQLVATLKAGSGGGGGSAGVIVAYSVGSTPNHFTYGYCTWYVASKIGRYIPWFADAGGWLSGARASGWATGSAPRVGAIEVSWPQYPGHVALVEAVYADGTFLVSEMNYRAWNTVDKRLVVPRLEPILGFIYP